MKYIGKEIEAIQVKPDPECVTAIINKLGYIPDIKSHGDTYISITLKSKRIAEIDNYIIFENDNAYIMDKYTFETLFHPQKVNPHYHTLFPKDKLIP